MKSRRGVGIGVERGPHLEERRDGGGIGGTRHTTLRVVELGCMVYAFEGFTGDCTNTLEAKGVSAPCVVKGLYVRWAFQGEQ